MFNSSNLNCPTRPSSSSRCQESTTVDHRSNIVKLVQPAESLRLDPVLYSTRPACHQSLRRARCEYHASSLWLQSQPCSYRERPLRVNRQDASPFRWFPRQVKEPALNTSIFFLLLMPVLASYPARNQVSGRRSGHRNRRGRVRCSDGLGLQRYTGLDLGQKVCRFGTEEVDSTARLRLSRILLGSFSGLVPLSSPAT